MDIEGASVLENFEVIEIVDDNNPYPALLGSNSATDMNGVIHLKKQKIIFENKPLCIIVPFNPAEGLRYTEPVHDYENDDDLDYNYKITARDQDWLNPTTDGWITWECKRSCTLDSNKEIERWQNRLHEVTTLNCNMMIRSLRCVSIEVRDLPTYDGLNEVDTLLDALEREVPERQHF